MENFKMVDVKDAPRVELHNQLGLTGCQVFLTGIGCLQSRFLLLLLLRQCL